MLVFIFLKKVGENVEIKGMIYDVNLKGKTISVLNNHKLKFFYFQNNLMKRFKKYLYKGNFIKLVAEDSTESRAGVYSHLVIYVSEIFVPTNHGKKYLYDKTNLNKSLIDFFDSLDYKLFLDLEMTMPGFNPNPDFVPEIIQAGFFIVDKEGSIIEKHNYHVRPTKVHRINRRTRDFLHMDSSVVKNAVSYYKFYNKFKQILLHYHPAILTFGKNDKLFLEKSYVINSLPSLNYISRFINLSQLIKNYYELKVDPGLFSLYEEYTGIENYQTHDALEDALMTFDVYNFFLVDMKNKNIVKKGELIRK